MHLLETYNVVGVKESFEIFEFELSVPLSGENRSDKAPGVPSNTSHAFGKEGATSIPPCSTLSKSVVVLEEHPVSSGSV